MKNVVIFIQTKEVALENKVGQQKSTCIDCGSKKSTFFKRVKNKKVFTNYKNNEYLL